MRGWARRRRENTQTRGAREQEKREIVTCARCRVHQSRCNISLNQSLIQYRGRDGVDGGTVLTCCALRFRERPAARVGWERQTRLRVSFASLGRRQALRAIRACVCRQRKKKKKTTRKSVEDWCQRRGKNKTRKGGATIGSTRAKTHLSAFGCLATRLALLFDTHGISLTQHRARILSSGETLEAKSSLSLFSLSLSKMKFSPPRLTSPAHTKVQ